MDFKINRKSHSWEAFAVLAGSLLMFGAGIALGLFLFRKGEGWNAILAPLVVFAISLIMAPIGGFMLLWPRLFPRKLTGSNGRIRLFHGKQLVGQIPLNNVVNVHPIRRQRKNAGLTGALLGGAAGALVGSLVDEASVRIESIGMILVLRRKDDPETFWPQFSGRRRIKITVEWEQTYDTIIRRIRDQLGISS